MNRFTKGESLEILAKNQLNTPVFAILRPPYSVDELVGSLGMFPGNVSVRTWQKGKLVCPFFPNRSPEEVMTIVRDLMEEGQVDEIILSEGIDPANSERCGRISHLVTDYYNETYAVIEYFEGPGTVRDLDTKSGTEKKMVEIPKWNFNAPELWMVYFMSKARPFFHKYPGSTLEWSYYPYAIGRKQDNLIFWEVL